MLSLFEPFANCRGKAMSTDENVLVEQAKTDPAAFGALYERYVQRIYSYVYYRVGNQHDAEDLTARTFFQALDKIEGYEDQGKPFSAWLYRIARNLVANWHRDQKRHTNVSLEKIMFKVQDGDAPDQVAEREEENGRLWAFIRRLPPDRQTLLILKFVDGMKNAEIGKILGRSEGAIKTLYYRTLVSLRRMFDAEEHSSQQ
jgi:RNA polymerase sigma-70 factor (ECF subfamily)